MLFCMQSIFHQKNLYFVFFFLKMRNAYELFIVPVKHNMHKYKVLEKSM